jgi:NAD(P)-dependent dehydrogenase (short-subunit alcohol dehydrogenase family)
MNDLKGGRDRCIEGHRRGHRQKLERSRRRSSGELCLQQGGRRPRCRRHQANGGTAIAVKGDVAKAADVRQLFAETKRVFDRPDVPVNNAGVDQVSAAGRDN